MEYLGEKTINVKDILENEYHLYPIWSDSLGAKSFSFALKNKDCLILVDPGASSMQPSYPLQPQEKISIRQKAKEKITTFFHKADTVVITHYHYDHYMRPSDSEIKDKSIFRKKINYYIKNPNYFINENQRKRAERFLEELMELNNKTTKDYHVQPDDTFVEEETEELLNRYLPKNTNMISGRLKKGVEWIHNIKSKWVNQKWIKNNIVTSGPKIVFADNIRTEECGFQLEFTEPLFHGGELEKTGWVIALNIVFSNKKIFYSSDLMGPVIEEYVDIIGRNKPEIILLDGPPLYLPPYMFPKRYIERAVSNIEKIIGLSPKIILLDHHPLRVRNWRKKLQQVYVKADKQGVKLITVAEALGKPNLIDLL